MANIIDYVEKEMDGFAEKTFSPVDSLVLSQFSYLDLGASVSGFAEDGQDVKLCELLRAEHFDRMFGGIRDPANDKRLLFALAASPRFRDMRIRYYVDELDTGLEKQFAAMTFFPDGKTAYIAFRGTDATFVGWKEDLNMAFMSPVPSQEAAVSYVRSVAQRFRGGLIIGGHSKGGNLAVYSAMMCAPSIQDRILRVYSHDGPGFKDDVFQSEEFRRISSRIDKTLPQSSLVGMLLENQENYSVIKSTRFGIMQHDPFSWIVEDGHFCVLEELSASAHYMDKTLSEWLGRLSAGERERFIDALYEALEADGISTFEEFGAEWQKNVPAVLTAIRDSDPETRKLVFQTLKELAVLAVKNIPYLHKDSRPAVSDGHAENPSRSQRHRD